MHNSIKTYVYVERNISGIQAYRNDLISYNCHVYLINVITYDFIFIDIMEY